MYYFRWNNTKKTLCCPEPMNLLIYNILQLAHIYMYQGSFKRELHYNDSLYVTCNMNAFFSFDFFMVYIPECKQKLRTMK